MLPLVRAASLTKALREVYCRAVIRRPLRGEAEIRVRSSDSKTTGPDGGSPPVNSQWSRSPATAFTLIELTVVILIIATLAALIMTGASSAIDHAKKVQVKNDITQLVNAVNAYYTDYGKYPMADTRQGTDTMYGRSGTAPGNEDICYVLRAINAGVNAAPSANYLNPRQIVFLSGRDSSRARSGFTTAATTDSQGRAINAGAFVDSWGNAYIIAIDGNYDGATVDSLPYTDLTSSYATVSGNKAVRTGCFAESFGKDGKQGKAGNQVRSGSDDVLSWQ